MTIPPHYIRDWRLHRGLTQEALAKATGIDRTLIAKVERFRNRYNQDILEGIAKALQCTTADLLLRHPDDPDGLWAEYNAMTLAERREAIAYVKGQRRAS